MEHFYRRSFLFGTSLRAMLIRRRDECAEQRMRLQRLPLELGMELAADEMRLVRQFDHFDVSPFGRRTRNPHPLHHHRPLLFTTEFLRLARARAAFRLPPHAPC